MASSSSSSCLIVGASHAGVTAAFALRRLGWSGTITLLDRDSELPYHRPPLSKGFLSGENRVEDSLLKGEAGYAAAGIERRLGLSVSAIDREKRRVALSDGTFLAYEKLVLATGSRPIKPPIPGLAEGKGVFTLRTAADARAIRKVFLGSARKRVVIIGGGYIGLEVAASLRKLGGEVMVLEREDRILARVTSPELSAFFTELHTEKGVRIMTGSQVSAVTKSKDALLVHCADGSDCAADLVVVGVGVTVDTSLAEAAGLKVTRGIAVDAGMRTSDPDIYAIGDCTSFHHPRYSREIHLESVQNAVDQAKVAAAGICGAPVAYDAIPWFWSDQFEVKLQMCGLSTGYDRVVLRQEVGEDPYQRSLWYFSGGELVAVDAVNHGRAYMLGMKFLREGNRPNPDRLADPTRELHPRSLLD